MLKTTERMTDRERTVLTTHRYLYRSKSNGYMSIAQVMLYIILTLLLGRYS